MAMGTDSAISRSAKRLKDLAVDAVSIPLAARTLQPRRRQVDRRKAPPRHPSKTKKSEADQAEGRGFRNRPSRVTAATDKLKKTDAPRRADAGGQLSVFWLIVASPRGVEWEPSY
jgi:hypothetical protein